MPAKDMLRHQPRTKSKTCLGDENTRHRLRTRELFVTTQASATGPAQDRPSGPPQGRSGGGGGYQGRPGGGGGYRGGPGGGRRPRGRFFPRRRRICPCVEGKVIDYKDIEFLRRFVTEQAKIESRRKTGMCSKCQRPLARAIKRARYLGMLPYARNHRGGQSRSF